MFKKFKQLFFSKNKEIEENKMFSQLRVKDPIYNVTVYYDLDRTYNGEILIEDVVLRKGFCKVFETQNENTIIFEWCYKNPYDSLRFSKKVGELNSFGPIVKNRTSVEYHLFTIKSMAEACYHSFLLKQEQLNNQLNGAINSQSVDKTVLLKAIEDSRKYIMSLVPKD